MLTHICNLVPLEPHFYIVGFTGVDVIYCDFCCAHYIRITCPCDLYPLTPHFCIVKLGFTGVYIIFFIFALKHRLWVLVRTASLGRF